MSIYTGDNAIDNTYNDTIGNLVCQNVSKEYKIKGGSKTALDDVNLELEQGKIYGLIGRNGAGKTTLLSIISAQNPLTAGEVKLGEETVWENTKALQHICFSRELNIGPSNGLANMKVKEYLKRAALYYPYWDQAYADRLVELFELDTRQKFSKLSKGMLSMVTITVAFASKAKFTFLDEPVAGLDVVARENFYQLLLEEQAESGRTFVVSTHIIEEAADYLEEVIILNKGRILLKENTVELVERAYQVSGLESVVDEAVKGLEVHHAKKTGRGKSVAVLLKEGERIPEGFDVTVAPMNLQNVFVALCGNEEGKHDEFTKTAE